MGIDNSDSFTGSVIPTEKFLEIISSYTKISFYKKIWKSPVPKYAPTIFSLKTLDDDSISFGFTSIKIPFPD